MLPLPQLDDKTFEQLVEDAKKWIPRYAPGWTDHHLHDPGITMIELLAWLTELQHYYLDQVREESELKFLKLLGVRPKTVKPAVVDITFSLPAGESGEIAVPAGTRLDAGGIGFETTEPIVITNSALTKVISQTKYGAIDQSDANLRGGLQFYPFGKDAEAESRLYLGFDQPLPAGQRLPVTFHLYDGYPVPKGSHGAEKEEALPSAHLVWEYYADREDGAWMPIGVEKDGTGMLARSGRITFRIPGNMEKRTLSPAVETPHYWIRATVAKSGYELPPRIDRILINTTAAEQTVTSGETIGTSNGLPGQTFRLGRYPVIPESLVLQVKEGGMGGEIWTNWTRVDSFDTSGPVDKHYVLDSSTGTLRFGNGRNGAIPKSSSEGDDNIRALFYKVTAGEKGNIRAESAWTVADGAGEPGKLLAGNRLPAEGGERPETLDESKMRARRELSDVDRAVTSEDYEQLARSTPGLRVARAKAIPLLGKHGPGVKGAVTVVVLPYSEYRNPMPSKGFLQTVCRHLDRHRLITTSLRVVPPDYVNVSVAADIHIKPGYHVPATRSKVEEALLAFLHPLTGGVDGTGWPFGRAVYRSELFQVIGRIDGVGCVNSLRISGTGSGAKQDREGNLLLTPVSLVYSDTHRIDAAAATAGCAVKGGCHGH